MNASATKVTFSFKVRRRVQLEQLHISLNAVIKLVYRAIRSPCYVLRNRRVHALEQVLSFIDLPRDGLELFELLGQEQLVFELFDQCWCHFARIRDEGTHQRY